MSYIAFLDMVGIQSSASMSSAKYARAIDDFNNALQQVNQSFPCRILGYSDNAYIEFNDLNCAIGFLRLFRELLMRNHHYFTAAVDVGSLKAESIQYPNQHSLSLKFTSPATVDIYLKQSQLSGIGISLSPSIIGQLQQEEYHQSVFLKQPFDEAESNIISFFDLSYSNVSLPALRFVFEDYLITSATNRRAGRYYITPIISMIKSLSNTQLQRILSDLINLISLKTIPHVFTSLPHNEFFSRCFIFALLDTVFTLYEHEQSFDKIDCCEKILKGQDLSALVRMLPTVSSSIINNENKHEFLKVLYGLDTPN